MKIDIWDGIGISLVLALGAVYVVGYYLPAQEQKKFDAAVQRFTDSATSGDLSAARSAFADIGAKKFNEFFEGAALSPLHIAAGKGQIEVVRFLIESGVQPDLKEGREGKTPLIVATALRQNAAAIALVDKGANVNERDAAQLSPLCYAAGEGEGDVVELLLKRGADVNNGTHTGPKRPLLYAAERGNIDIVKVLLASGAYVGFLDAQVADSGGYKDIGKLLQRRP